MSSKPISSTAKKETDQVLGKLPAGWQKVKYRNTDRCYFVHHPSKTTSWIDPRTKNTRALILSEAKEFELPYGWEEIHDPEFGIYFADHISKLNFDNGPWDKNVREKSLDARARIELSSKPTEVSIEAPIAPKIAINSNIQKSKTDVKVMEINALQDMKVKLEIESSKRLEIEQQILSIKDEIYKITNSKLEQTAECEDVPETNHKDAGEELQITIEENKRLEKINSWMISERDRLSKQALQTTDSDYQMPSWIAGLDRGTIRARVKKELPSNPDEMQFIQKLANFEIKAKDSHEAAKAPVGLRGAKNEFAIQPKETGFASEDRPAPASVWIE